MKLAQNEKIIKETCYAVSKDRGLTASKEEHWIILTNKRIVSLRKKKGTQLGMEDFAADISKEICIKDVVGVSSNFKTKSNLGAYVIMALGVIAGIMAFMLLKNIHIFVGIIGFILVGGLLVLLGFKRLNQYTLSIDVTTRGVISNALHIGSGKIISRKRANLDVVDLDLKEVKIDKKAISEIINEIGSIIVDNQ